MTVCSLVCVPQVVIRRTGVRPFITRATSMMSGPGHVSPESWAAS